MCLYIHTGYTEKKMYTSDNNMDNNNNTTHHICYSWITYSLEYVTKTAPKKKNPTSTFSVEACVVRHNRLDVNEKYHHLPDKYGLTKILTVCL